MIVKEGVTDVIGTNSVINLYIHPTYLAIYILHLFDKILNKCFSDKDRSRNQSREYKDGDRQRRETRDADEDHLQERECHRDQSRSRDSDARKRDRDSSHHRYVTIERKQKKIEGKILSFSTSCNRSYDERSHREYRDRSRERSRERRDRDRSRELRVPPPHFIEHIPVPIYCGVSIFDLRVVEYDRMKMLYFIN